MDSSYAQTTQAQIIELNMQSFDDSRRTSRMKKDVRNPLPAFIFQATLHQVNYNLLERPRTHLGGAARHHYTLFGWDSGQSHLKTTLRDCCPRYGKQASAFGNTWMKTIYCPFLHCISAHRLIHNAACAGWLLDGVQALGAHQAQATRVITVRVGWN